MKITAAEASWSNGISELHNVTLTDIIVKVKEDLNCDWEAALAWAGSTKNCLIKVSSFSPHGAIFGTNIILVSIYNDKLSADLLQNQRVIAHFSAVHATRQAFITTEYF